MSGSECSSIEIGNSSEDSFHPRGKRYIGARFRRSKNHKLSKVTELKHNTKKMERKRKKTGSWLDDVREGENGSHLFKNKKIKLPVGGLQNVHRSTGITTSTASSPRDKIRDDTNCNVNKWLSSKTGRQNESASQVPISSSDMSDSDVTEMSSDTKDSEPHATSSAKKKYTKSSHRRDKQTMSKDTKEQGYIGNKVTEGIPKTKECYVKVRKLSREEIDSNSGSGGTQKESVKKSAVKKRAAQWEVNTTSSSSENEDIFKRYACSQGGSRHKKRKHVLSSSSSDEVYGQNSRRKETGRSENVEQNKHSRIQKAKKDKDRFSNHERDGQNKSKPEDSDSEYSLISLDDSSPNGTERPIYDESERPHLKLSDDETDNEMNSPKSVENTVTEDSYATKLGSHMSPSVKPISPILKTFSPSAFPVSHSVSGKRNSGTDVDTEDRTSSKKASEENTNISSEGESQLLLESVPPVANTSHSPDLSLPSLKPPKRRTSGMRKPERDEQKMAELQANNSYSGFNHLIAERNNSERQMKFTEITDKEFYEIDEGSESDSDLPIGDLAVKQKTLSLEKDSLSKKREFSFKTNDGHSPLLAEEFLDFRVLQKSENRKFVRVKEENCAEDPPFRQLATNSSVQSSNTDYCNEGSRNSIAVQQPHSSKTSYLPPVSRADNSLSTKKNHCQIDSPKEQTTCEKKKMDEIGSHENSKCSHFIDHQLDSDEDKENSSEIQVKKEPIFAYSQAEDPIMIYGSDDNSTESFSQEALKLEDDDIQGEQNNWREYFCMSDSDIEDSIFDRYGRDQDVYGAETQVDGVGDGDKRRESLDSNADIQLYEIDSDDNIIPCNEVDSKDDQQAERKRVSDNMYDLQTQIDSDFTKEKESKPNHKMIDMYDAETQEIEVNDDDISDPYILRTQNTSSVKPTLSSSLISLSSDSSDVFNDGLNEELSQMPDVDYNEGSQGDKKHRGQSSSPCTVLPGQSSLTKKQSDQSWYDADTEVDELTDDECHNMPLLKKLKRKSSSKIIKEMYIMATQVDTKDGESLKGEKRNKKNTDCDRCSVEKEKTYYKQNQLKRHKGQSSQDDEAYYTETQKAIVAESSEDEGGIYNAQTQAATVSVSSEDEDKVYNAQTQAGTLPVSSDNMNKVYEAQTQADYLPISSDEDIFYDVQTQAATVPVSSDDEDKVYSAQTQADHLPISSDEEKFYDAQTQAATVPVSSDDEDMVYSAQTQADTVPVSSDDEDKVYSAQTQADTVPISSDDEDKVYNAQTQADTVPVSSDDEEKFYHAQTQAYTVAVGSDDEDEAYKAQTQADITQASSEDDDDEAYNAQTQVNAIRISSEEEEGYQAETQVYDLQRSSTEEEDVYSAQTQRDAIRVSSEDDEKHYCTQTQEAEYRRVENRSECKEVRESDKEKSEDEDIYNAMTQVDAGSGHNSDKEFSVQKLSECTWRQQPSNNQTEGTSRQSLLHGSVNTDKLSLSRRPSVGKVISIEPQRLKSTKEKREEFKIHKLKFYSSKSNNSVDKTYRGTEKLSAMGSVSSDSWLSKEKRVNSGSSKQTAQSSTKQARRKRRSREDPEVNLSQQLVKAKCGLKEREFKTAVNPTPVVRKQSLVTAKDITDVQLPGLEEIMEKRLPVLGVSVPVTKHRSSMSPDHSMNEGLGDVEMGNISSRQSEKELQNNTMPLEKSTLSKEIDCKPRMTNIETSGKKSVGTNNISQNRKENVRDIHADNRPNYTGKKGSDNSGFVKNSEKELTMSKCEKVTPPSDKVNTKLSDKSHERKSSTQSEECQLKDSNRKNSSSKDSRGTLRDGKRRSSGSSSSDKSSSSSAALKHSDQGKTPQQSKENKDVTQMHKSLPKKDRKSSSGYKDKNSDSSGRDKQRSSSHSNSHHGNSYDSCKFDIEKSTTGSSSSSHKEKSTPSGSSHKEKTSQSSFNPKEKSSQSIHRKMEKSSQSGNHKEKSSHSSNSLKEKISQASQSHKEKSSQSSHSHTEKGSQSNHTHKEKSSHSSHNNKEKSSQSSQSHKVKGSQSSHSLREKDSQSSHNHKEKGSQSSHTHRERGSQSSQSRKEKRSHTPENQKEKSAHSSNKQISSHSRDKSYKKSSNSSVSDRESTSPSYKSVTHSSNSHLVKNTRHSDSHKEKDSQSRDSLKKNSQSRRSSSNNSDKEKNRKSKERTPSSSGCSSVKSSSSSSSSSQNDIDMKKSSNSHGLKLPSQESISKDKKDMNSTFKDSVANEKSNQAVSMLNSAENHIQISQTSTPEGDVICDEPMEIDTSSDGVEIMEVDENVDEDVELSQKLQNAKVDKVYNSQEENGSLPPNNGAEVILTEHISDDDICIIEDPKVSDSTPSESSHRVVKSILKKPSKATCEAKKKRVTFLTRTQAYVHKLIAEKRGVFPPDAGVNTARSTSFNTGRSATQSRAEPARRSGTVLQPTKVNLMNKVPLNAVNQTQVVSSMHSRQPTSTYKNRNQQLAPSAGHQVTVDDFLKRLLSWRPVWFDEHEKVKCVPPPIEEQNKLFHIPEKMFSSFKDYSDIFIPHLVFETWETIVRDWSTRQGENRLSLTAVCGNIEEHTDKAFKIYTFYGVTSKNKFEESRKFEFWSENLVTLHMLGVNKHVKDKTPERNRPHWYDQLGYIEKSQPVVQEEPKRKILTKFPVLAKEAQAGAGPCVVFVITVKVAYRHFLPHPQQLSEIKPVVSLTTILRQFIAMRRLPTSILCKHILKPESPAVFYETANISASEQKYLSRYNSTQQRVICNAAKIALQEQNQCRITLVQGPPGTGKSHTIVGIIDKILKDSNFTAKVCICAPSNAAVDEITSRLIAFRQRKKEDNVSVNIVRIGTLAKMQDNVKPYSLTEHLKRSVTKDDESLIGDVPDSVKVDYAFICQKLDTLKKEEYCLLRAGKNQQRVIQIRDEIRKINRKKDEMDYLKTKMPRSNPEYIYTKKREILTNAHVICGTLNAFGKSEHMNMLVDKYTGRSMFRCVIIDEASQANELDCLIPLQYGSSKLILVGDPVQLPPTVLSQKSAEKNFGQSLFERFFNYFKDKENNPVMCLDIQYRMAPDIARFPSSHMYNGILKTDESVKEECKRSPLQPYILYDLAESQEDCSQNSRSISNTMEADFIICLAAFILHNTEIPKENIGVIAPYKNQEVLLNTKFAQSKMKKIEVSTVDRFQGREKTVIILSCVRAQSETGSIGFMADKKRLNVALTRAKTALYIVGHLDSLKDGNHDWRHVIDDAANRKLIYQVASRMEFNKAVNRCKNRHDSHSS